MTGVSPGELHCPTCRQPFPQPLQAYRLPGKTVPESVMSEVTLGTSMPLWYVCCREGHRWTLGTVYHSQNGNIIGLLLDKYIGQEL